MNQQERQQTEDNLRVEFAKNVFTVYNQAQNPKGSDKSFHERIYLLVRKYNEDVKNLKGKPKPKKQETPTETPVDEGGDK